MRVLMSGGGTGGHVYPLLVIAESLQRQNKDADILYVGSKGGMEADIVSQSELPYREVDTGPIRGANPLALLRNLGRVFKGYRQTLALMAEWPADALLVTGGYVSVPVALAARRRGVPFIIYLPDREPGWAVRFLGRYAERIAVSFSEFAEALPKAVQHKVWDSGYPVRASLLKADRAEACRTLGLDPALRTLLVLGGSRGARAINLAIESILTDALERWQVIHASGQLDWPRVKELREQLPEALRARYRAYPYLHQELSPAMAAADLVVSRAGASTMAEFPAVGLPSVLVPYPYAGQHQALNADFLQEHGAAVRLDEADLGEQLWPTLVRLLGGPALLNEMGDRAKTLSRPDAAERLAGEVARLAGVGEERGP